MEEHAICVISAVSIAVLRADRSGTANDKLAIAQLVVHLTVDSCSDQMVPGSIPGGRIFGDACGMCKLLCHTAKRKAVELEGKSRLRTKCRRWLLRRAAHAGRERALYA